MPDQHYIRLPIKKAFNIRDLGGYSCTHGRVTGWKTFLRGDNLAFLNAEDIHFLKAYGLKTVIDLRSADELSQFPNPFYSDTDIGFYTIPFMAGNIGDITRELAQKPAEFLQTFYTMLLDQGKDSLRIILEIIAKHNEGALLFHCNVGKDRTGILAMILLSIAGVSKADIISNYCTSYFYNMENPRIQKLRTSTPSEILASSPKYIISAMDYLDTNYGSIEKYLASIGVKSNILHQIREHFCVQ